MNRSTVLIIEDESKIALMTRDYLEAKEFKCKIALNGKDGLTILGEGAIDLVLLDWMLPDINGLEVSRKIRTRSDIPIIMLTARDAEEDKVIGLDNGADDYIVKPFSLKELTARVNAHLRRRDRSMGRLTGEEIFVPPFRLNRKIRRVWKREVEIKLSSMRFDLFSLFLENPEQVFTRDQIMEQLSGGGFYEGFDRTIDAHIKNLRKVIEDTPSSPRYIVTVRGIGYKLARIL